MISFRQNKIVIIIFVFTSVFIPSLPLFHCFLKKIWPWAFFIPKIIISFGKVCAWPLIL